MPLWEIRLATSPSLFAKTRETETAMMVTMLNMNVVREGVQSILVFSNVLVNDLEEDGEGFAGWQHNFSNLEAAREVADYIVGSAQAVGSNLQALAVHLQDYKDLRYSQDIAMTMMRSKTGGMFPKPPDAHFNEKELRLDAVERAFFVTVGSVMDCLTATLIGLAGLKLDIHRADSGVLLPVAGATDYPSKKEHEKLFRSLAPAGAGRDEQVKAIRAIATSLAQSGPDQWLDWTLGMRNMVVHREHRGELIIADQQKDRSYDIWRLPASNPNLSNLQGFRAGGDALQNYYLHEDLLKTMEGIAGSANATVAASAQSLQNLWDLRKSAPSLIAQPIEQWPGNRRAIAFAGYNPGSPGLSKQSGLTLNPADWKRLRAGGLGTTNHEQ
jgi:hypothetical protein